MKSEANKESRDRKLYQLSDTLLHLFARFLNDDSIPIVIEYCFDIYVRQRESTKIETSSTSITKKPVYLDHYHFGSLCLNMKV